jgi:N-glycosylase/DNA lyase
VVGEKVLKVRQEGCDLEFENADEGFIRRYFGLHDNLPRIFEEINRDEHVDVALRQFEGLRILRQDPWECLISYICATYKNIAAIKLMLWHLSRKFGERISFDGHSFFRFPAPLKLGRATLRELTECGLGYRARYVSQTANRVCEDDYDLEHLKIMSHDGARRELLSFPGVGQKVADCVLLFSLEKLEAFPIDVWIRRTILRHYGPHFSSEFVHRISRKESLSTTEYNRLNMFGREYFGRHAGYAQEYLYHYERTRRRRARSQKTEIDEC